MFNFDKSAISTEYSKFFNETNCYDSYYYYKVIPTKSFLDIHGHKYTLDEIISWKTENGWQDDLLHQIDIYVDNRQKLELLQLWKEC